MTDTQLPDISGTSLRLALDNVRVQKFLDGLTPHIDELVAAVKDKNWTEAGRLSHFIYRCSEVYGYPEIAEIAGSVCNAAAGGDKQLAGRHVLKLLGAYARAGRKTMV
ncbi:Hpt domain-containing protein [Blastopirellula retiformator]|uniref:Hpt domain-containing protein n=1 Tax=Blastopirellula retiformator TaxID=2527970 RepID=UPI0011B5FE5B|nr:Hpt domain-containing protein [Blastopirellula retiformator]